MDRLDDLLALAADRDELDGIAAVQATHPSPDGIKHLNAAARRWRHAAPRPTTGPTAVPQAVLDDDLDLSDL